MKTFVSLIALIVPLCLTLSCVQPPEGGSPPVEVRALELLAIVTT
ncbi:MAG: hypothetical protein U5N26_02945 [Candidatus Marinimicrobia bacterium]|nr:hypothetical protein [Candidatus Neomarinimicrobiota bacterium]